MGILDDLAQQVNGEWHAHEPPAGLLVERKGGDKADHWYDRYAYVTLYLPRKGASTQNRRFGLNHTIVYSYLVSRAKGSDWVIRKFTVAGFAAMIGLNFKTITTILQDLETAGLLERQDLGRCSDIQLLPLTDNHFQFFDLKPEIVAENSENDTIISDPKYVLKHDGYDDFRRICENLMPQESCEKAIRKARRLGDTLDYLHEQLEAACNQHQQNVREGKIGKGHFGNYFNRRLQTRLDQIEEDRRKEEVIERLRDYQDSPEGKAAAAKRKEQAAADPMHREHTVSVESITDRVRFSDNPLENRQKAERLFTIVYKHCSRFCCCKGSRTSGLGGRNEQLVSTNYEVGVEQGEPLLSERATGYVRRNREGYEPGD